MPKMNRRDFLHDSTAFAAALASAGMFGGSLAPAAPATKKKGDANDKLHVAVLGVQPASLNLSTDIYVWARRHTPRLRPGLCALEHRVAVLGSLGNGLDAIPVLYDLAVVIEPEDIDARPIAFPRPFRMHVHNHVIALSDHTHEMCTLPGIDFFHPFKMLNDRLRSICYALIVLNVHISGVLLERFGGLTLVEHEIIKRQDIFFVPLKSICHGSYLAKTDVG